MSQEPEETTSEEAEEPLVRLEDLRKVYAVGSRHRLFGRSERSLIAVDEVSLEVERAEVVGLVGESGCGKSTLGLLTLRLLEPTSGRIFFDGQDITDLHISQLRPLRRHMQIVLQNPLASLNPRLTVREIIAEPLRIHGPAASRTELTEQVVDLLSQVGLGRQHLQRYPHEFSGGQRQRICIARALAPRPKFILADEPLSALDVSVQAQIINLLLALQHELGLAFLFISHDLNVVGTLARRVAVMYLGLLVELGPTRELYAEPLHPYSQALLAVVPRLSTERRQAPLLRGEPPDPIAPPPGCAFHPRCPLGEGRCKDERPALREVAPGRLVRCHLV